MTNLQIVNLPAADVRDIPKMLRELADRIESGEYKGAHNLVWALDTGNANIEVGLMGQAAETGAVAYLLLGLAQHKIASELKNFV